MTATVPSEQRGTAAALRLRAEVFDRRCAELGAENGITRAALVEVDRGTVRRWKLGEVTPQLDVAMRVAQRLDLKVDDLWETAA
jgi:DNA-binding XRE family transcriptional regulator